MFLLLADLVSKVGVFFIFPFLISVGDILNHVAGLECEDLSTVTYVIFFAFLTTVKFFKVETEIPREEPQSLARLKGLDLLSI
jgi:hypothetical protein